MNLIPKKLQPYFKETHQTKAGDNTIIEGILTCCNTHDFEVCVVGEIKHGLFSKMHIFPKNDRTVVKVRCRKCGRIISVFDSACDGYEQCEKKQCTHVQTESIDCKKCISRK